MDGPLIFRFLFALCLVLICSTAALGTKVIFYDPSETDFAKKLNSKLTDAGFEVAHASGDEIIEVLNQNPALLVLPDARQFPAKALGALEEYMDNRGCLLAIGTPAFERLTVKWEDSWYTTEQILANVTSRPPDKMLFQIQPGDEEKWQRYTNRPDFEERLSVNDGALASFVEKVEGWNTYQCPPVEDPFGGGHTLTVFEAMGHPNTTRLWLEWREKDGSRWMAEVNIGERWRRHVVPPTDFSFWPQGSPAGRGGPGDQFNPENADTLYIGLAENFGRMPAGSHLWWVRNIGVSTDPAEVARVELPRMETISPAYKTYPMDSVSRLSARMDQAIVDASFSLSGNFSGNMPIWRARGLGHFADTSGPMRYIPLVDAYDKQGNWRGTAAWMLVNLSGSRQGSIWGSIGVNPDNLKSAHAESLASLGATMAQRMVSAPFLASAGAPEFALSPEGSTHLGARVVNPHGPDGEIRTSFILFQEAKQRPLHENDSASISMGGSHEWLVQDVEYKAVAGPARIVTRLFSGDKLVDMISQPISMLAEQGNRSFFTVQDGQFVLNGKPVFINAVNYWPRSAMALEPGEYHLGWLIPWQYDPEVVERDLRTLADLNVNVLSIQYMQPRMGPQLVDFLERCRTHRIYVNIFVDGANPVSINLERLGDLVEQARLKGNPQVFAYDLAWEPNLGLQSRRAMRDPEWREWIVEQYGSLERAEQDWGFPVERDAEGLPTSPKDEHLMEDGEWRIMVAAYRRFADDMISRGYGEVTRFLKEHSPEHLLGVRTGYGGTGQMWVARFFPFDLISGAAHLDFTSPEGYGLQGELDNFLAAGFTTEYGRFVSGGRPVFWAELGKSVWPRPFDEDTLEIQRQEYEFNYRLFIKSHANGAAAWWYPAGYRVDENSDYGIVRQDEIPRPSALVIRDWGQKAQNSLSVPTPDGTILIDRDKHVSGYAGVWAEARQEYLTALKQGKRLVPRTVATGTTSKTVPAEAVGGVPWTGDNPHKHLNAEFARVYVLNANDEWQEWTGEAIQVKRSQPVMLRTELINTGEPLWLKDAGGDGTGSVTLGISQAGTLRYIPLVDDVPTLGFTTLPEFHASDGLDAPGELSLRMNLTGHHSFGQRVTINLTPVN